MPSLLELAAHHSQPSHIASTSRHRVSSLIVVLLAGLVLAPVGLCQTPAPSSRTANQSTPETPKTRHDPTSATVADGREYERPLTASGATAPSATGARSTHPDAPQPLSMFDALPRPLAPTTTTVEVHAAGQDLETSQPEAFQAGGQEIVSSAGTFGDLSRYVGTLPGVVTTSDLSNEFLVRGGHPMENLFLVDGIEVPNINHLATMGTTGGFGPMIDSAVVQGIEVHTGGFEARYPERLSSVTEITTLNHQHLTAHAEGDVGIEGLGGLAEKAIDAGDLLVSAHHGILAVLNDFGINDLPSYTNELARYRHNDASGNRWTVLHLAGWDSYQVTPCAADPLETSSLDSQYSGWRETTGVQWQRVNSARSFGVATLSDSQEVQHINQQDQILNPADIASIVTDCPLPASLVQATPVYMENSNDGFDTASYHFEWGDSRFALSAGSSFWLKRPHYQIEQPVGAYSPYSVEPMRVDSTSFASDFSIGESGTYAQLTATPLKMLSVSAGGRLQTFAFGDHATFTPRLSLRYGLGEHVGLHADFARYAQLPPYVYLLSYPANRTMLPMRATHQIVGMDVSGFLSSEIHVEAYNKAYSDIPASTEYPSVNLHDMVDMLGQQFVWLPMNSGARGASSGIELSELTRLHSSLVVRGSIAYSRAMFAGLDHVARPSNFDLPWIVNAAMLKQFGRGYQLASRYGYSTGRPYTPYDLPDSFAQNRPIYDVTEMNKLRVPYYGRWDAQMNKDALVGHLHLEIYAGVDNLLNRENFLAYVWLPRATCRQAAQKVDELYQMPIFPNAGLRYIFR